MRHVDLQKLGVSVDISIHAPTWGATPLREHHPHQIDISIHAPTWGATCKCRAPYRDGQISIHAPTWGATGARNGEIIITLFQSTHPRGVRRGRVIGRYSYRHFNPRTHVGCDSILLGLSKTPCHFNPRTHVGCDINGQSTIVSFMNFNPRTHVGCDWCNFASKGHSFPYFNPRTHVGCDFIDLNECLANGISIHAPTWGATKSP